MEHYLNEQQVEDFRSFLKKEERAETTIEKYMHNLTKFAAWNQQRAVTKEIVTEWKEYLLKSGAAAVTVNAALAALHSFFSFMQWTECRVKYLKIQRQLFRDASRELNREEYGKLIACALKSGKDRLALLMETICSTGIRVSELQYVTAEAVKKGRADISLKGKIRTILLPNKLVRKLQKYMKKQKITCGEIFLTAGGKGLSRRQIWYEMKQICRLAGVDQRKVFPHNLRHLFARAYYKACHDIVQLADVLGHSSIETTRIYLITTGEEHARQLDRLGFV